MTHKTEANEKNYIKHNFKRVTWDKEHQTFMLFRL